VWREELEKLLKKTNFLKLVGENPHQASNGNGNKLTWLQVEAAQKGWKVGGDIKIKRCQRGRGGAQDWAIVKAPGLTMTS